MQNRNKNLSNQSFSNMTIGTLSDQAKDLISKAHDTANKIQSEASHTEIVQDKPAPSHPKQEAKVLYMHPLTFVLGAVGVLVLATASIVIYKHYTK